MIRLHKMASVARGTHVEAETVDEAITHFDLETKYLVVRCDFDEEAIGLEMAVFQKNALAMKAAMLASAREPTWIDWQAKSNFAEGSGWRTIWCPQPVKGQPAAAPPRLRGH